MPRKAGYLSEPDQRLGPKKMAAKFRQQKTSIDWPKIDSSLCTLRSCYESEFRPVATAADQGLLTSAAKRYLVVLVTLQNSYCTDVPATVPATAFARSANAKLVKRALGH